jgi:hypothetical protein
VRDVYLDTRAGSSVVSGVSPTRRMLLMRAPQGGWSHQQRPPLTASTLPSHRAMPAGAKACHRGRCQA